MKASIVGFVVIVIAVIVGYACFSIMGVDSEQNATLNELGIEKVGDTKAMMKTLLICVISAAVIGGLFIAFVLPRAAQKMAEFTYNQIPEQYVESPLDLGRSLVLQGKYEEALEAFREAVDEDKPDRMVWWEISNLQIEHLEDPEGAMKTLEEGWEFAEWEMDDDVTFMFRLAVLYLEEKEDRDKAVELYKQVIEKYAENDYQCTRARTELLKLGVVA